MKTRKFRVLSFLIVVVMMLAAIIPASLAASEEPAESAGESAGAPAESSGAPVIPENMLANSDINIRDPFIITYDGRYYMYGTEGEIAFSDAMNRFLVYVSDDLAYWEGPFVIFENDGSFWANQKYWAPAMFVRDGTFYFYGAMGGEGRNNNGIQLFTADNPLGPFTPVSEFPMTDDSYEAIDAEIWEEDGKTYMVFSSNGLGGIMCAELTDTLDAFASEPVKLFDVGGCGWAQPLFGDSLLNDGAALLRTDDGRLVCFFSTTGPTGYNMGYAVSDNGKLSGNWECTTARMLTGTSGGHNMFFINLNGEQMTAYHSPNFPGRPTFKYVKVAESGEIFFVD